MTHAPPAGTGLAEQLPEPPTSNRRAAALHSFAVGAGWLAVAAGAMALVGWAAGIDLLESFRAGHSRMNPATAICLIIGGLALCRGASAVPRRLPSIGGAVVALTGVLRLGDLAGAWHSRVDDILFSDQLRTLTAGDDGRMSFTTASALVCLGAALVLSHGQRRRVVAAQVLAAIIAAIAIAALIGHAYGSSTLYTFSSSVMSLPTAAALLLLAAGVVALDARTGLGLPIASDGPGGRLVRHVLPVAVAIPFVIGVARLVAERAGLVDVEGGVAMVVAASIMLLVVLLWWAALRLDALDRAREAADRVARESEIQYGRLLDTSPDGMWVHEGGRLLYANPASVRLLGLRSPSDVVGRSVIDFVPAESRDIVAERIRWIGRGWKPSAAFEQEFVRADGSRIECELFAIPINYHGTPAIQATLRDVTARRVAERRLAASEARFRTLLESAPDAMVIVDGVGDVVLVNGGAERFFGWPRTELSGRPVDELIPTAARAARDAHRAHLEARRSWPLDATLELRAIRRDGVPTPVEVTMSPIDTLDGPLIMTAIRDVAERVRIDDELRRANAELERALAEVKRLSGLLPICASCKRVRDDSGYWHRLEEYVRLHSDADFTHGICPECMRRLYGELADEDP